MVIGPYGSMEVFQAVRISEYRATYIIINVIVAIFLLSMLVFGVYFWIAASAMLSRHYEPEVVFSTSPDGRYELVACEFSCLGGAGADIYIRDTESKTTLANWKKNEIGNISGDDYYQPISGGTYYVEWETDRVTIYYYEHLLAENRNDRSTWQGVLTYELE